MSVSIFSQVRKYVEGFCAVLAGVGFFLLIGEALLSVTSIIGRNTIDYGVPGDYELVQLLTAVAIAMCLPYCEFKRGHVFVDFFTLWASDRLKHVLDAIAALILAAVSFLIAWRTYVGMWEIRDYSESTMVLNVPVWWAYIPLPICFALLGVAALFNFHLECSKRDS